MNIIYKLSDGRFWNTEKGEWISEKEIGDPREIVPLISGEGLSDEAYLSRTLAFYAYSPGELANTTPTQGLCSVDDDLN